MEELAALSARHAADLQQTEDAIAGTNSLLPALPRPHAEREPWRRTRNTRVSVAIPKPSLELYLGWRQYISIRRRTTHR